MAFELSEINESVLGKMQDDAKFLGQYEIDSAIQDAIRQLNKDKPLLTVKDIAGDGTQDYVLPSEFEKGFSDILTVEHPAGENPPIFRRRHDDWFLYEDPTKAAGSQLRLRFKATQPSAADVIRIIIKSTHTVTSTSSTLSQNDFLAVVYKTMVFAFRSLAAKYTEGLEPSINADAINYDGKNEKYLFLAERWEAEYKKMAGLSDVIKADGLNLEGDIVFSHGEDFLFHPKRTR